MPFTPPRPMPCIRSGRGMPSGPGRPGPPPYLSCPCFKAHHTLTSRLWRVYTLPEFDANHSLAAKRNCRSDVQDQHLAKSRTMNFFLHQLVCSVIDTVVLTIYPPLT